MASQPENKIIANTPLAAMVRRPNTIFVRNFTTLFGNYLLDARANLTTQSAEIRSLAEHYLLVRDPAFDTVRFDVVGILLDKGPPRVRHIEDAF